MKVKCTYAEKETTKDKIYDVVSETIDFYRIVNDYGSLFLVDKNDFVRIRKPKSREVS